jgi:hypothetical protein
MMTSEQRRRVIQTIWRRAPSLSLRSRMESLRRAQQVVMLGRILDRISADAGHIVERSPDAAVTQEGLSPVINTTLGNLGHNSGAGSQRMTKKVDLRKLLQKVETAHIGSPELDSEFTNTFQSAPPHVTRSIDAAVKLIETELPGWWWNCGYGAVRNGASLYIPGSSQIRMNLPSTRAAPEYGPSPEHLRLLQDPKWGRLFDSGFHCERGSTVPLAMLTVFLEAKIALMCAEPAASADKAIRLNK